MPDAQLRLTSLRKSFGGFEAIKGVEKKVEQSGGRGVGGASGPGGGMGGTERQLDGPAELLARLLDAHDAADVLASPDEQPQAPDCQWPDHLHQRSVL